MVIDTAELYDPNTGTWSYTGNMNFDRENYAAILLNDGKRAGNRRKIWASNVLNSAELYNPSTGTWSITGSMSFNRAGHTATLLNNGKVLVAGGNYGGSTFVGTELYNPSTGTWSATGSINFIRADHGATLLNSGKVLVAGGNVEVKSKRVLSYMTHLQEPGVPQAI